MKFRFKVAVHEQANLGELRSVIQQITAIGEIERTFAPLQYKTITGYVFTADVVGVFQNITVMLDDIEEAKGFMHGYDLAQKEIEINDYLRSLGWEPAETPFKLVEER